MKKALKVSPNKAGTKYALVDNRDGTYSVYVLCANYAGHVRGGIAYSWRLSNDRTTTGNNLTLDQADALFAKRLAGKRR